MPDAQIHPTGTVATPADYVVPGQAELLLKGVYAKFDGSGAAGSYQPLVRIISDAGSTVIEAVADTTVAAGASADASWFPHLGGGSGGTASLPCCYLNTSVNITLNPWGGSWTSATWGSFTTNDPTTFSWSAGAPTAISYAPAGVYRCIYEMQVIGSSWPAAPAKVLNRVLVPGLTGATSQQFSLNAANADLYRGDPNVAGNFWGPTGERVFNDNFGSNTITVQLAYTGATSVTVALVCFVYRIGNKVF